MGVDHQDKRDPAALATIRASMRGRFMWGSREWFVDELNEKYSHVELVDFEERDGHETGRRRIERADLCNRLDQPDSDVVSIDLVSDSDIDSFLNRSQCLGRCRIRP